MAAFKHSVLFRAGCIAVSVLLIILLCALRSVLFCTLRQHTVLSRPWATSFKEDSSSDFRPVPGSLSMDLVIVPFLGYNASDEAIMEREEEYRIVLQRNLNHRFVSRVHLLTTNPKETLQRFKGLSNHDKLVVAEVKSTDFARDPWDYISENLVGKDVMFANADIYLGGGFELVNPLVMSQQKIMYSLTRQVAPGEKCEVDKCLEMDYIGSHDVFLLRLTEPLPEEALQQLEFDLVCLGMENIVLWIFQNMLKYCTLNPCSILETFHLHCGNLRNKFGKPRMNNDKSGGAPFTKALVCSPQAFTYC